MPDKKNMKFGKYLLLQLIGIGGMAEVYKAKISGEMGFEKLLVIKKILPNLAVEKTWVEHFIDEAKLAALLQHENIIHIYDFGSIGKSWFMAMEYLSGKDLKTIMATLSANYEKMPLEIALHIISKICEGLDYAHNLNDLAGKHLKIIHRDISPANIFITYNGKVKIIDFGIAKTLSNSHHTQTGTIKGKFAYMSPEQASGKEIDHRSDIYSLGIIFYEILTGERLFEGELHEVLLNVISMDGLPGEKLENLPSKVCDILKKATAKDIQERYSSCSEMLSDLDDCMYELGMRPKSKIVNEFMKSFFEKDMLEEDFGTQTIDKAKGSDMEATKVLPQEIKLVRLLKSGMKLSYQKLWGIIKTFCLLIKKATAFIIRPFSPVFFNWLKRNKRLLSVIITILFIVSGVFIRQHINKIKIHNFITMGNESLDTNDLVLPEENSAYYYFSEVLKIDPNNKDALKGLEETRIQSEVMAKRMLRLFQQKKALEYIAGGLKIDPDNKALLELKKKAEKKVSDRIFGGFKKLFNSYDKNNVNNTKEE